MKLTTTEEKFVLHWGEMGSRWGINRTVAQIHALLYISPEALNAEEIVETLSVARSNVSTSLKELQGWRIVKVVHRMGDRRDHFETYKDPWELFEIILAERKRREIDPTVALVAECIKESQSDKATSDYAVERLRDLDNFMKTMIGMYENTAKLPRSALMKLAKAGKTLHGFLGLK